MMAGESSGVGTRGSSKLRRRSPEPGQASGPSDSGLRNSAGHNDSLRVANRFSPPIIHPVAKKILIVEDTKSIREIVAFMLRSKGYETSESGDGQDAEARVRADPPDLIVLDAMLPKKTGFDVCQSLKADEKLKKIPILMLTAITRDTGK